MTTRNIIRLILAAVAALALTACDTVLQYPEGNGVDPTRPHGRILLTIKADAEFQHLGTFEYDFENPLNLVTARAEIADHVMRYKINAYHADDRSDNPIPLATKIFTSDIRTDIHEELDLELYPGPYRLVVWADCVEAGNHVDKYYDTSDFAEIVLTNPDGSHPGSNVLREAFYGETTLTVLTSTDPTVTATIEMKRPMAKYTFVSTDLDEFLDMESGRTGRTGRGDPMHAPAMALDDYRVRMVYNRYMPTTFNAHTGKPVDSRLGVEYSSSITNIDGKNAQLGFDYVFTNGAETSVNMAMEVIHSDGTVVARMPAFDVPLKRASHTIISGKFLTTKSGGEIGINPGFDGEYNIFIH